MKEYVTHSADQTEAAAMEIAPLLRSGDLLAYRGGMGAGKTTFTRGLAKGLGLKDPVSSPTFALVHEYRDGETPLYHFDLYRISGFDDLYSTGFYDYLDRGGILAVEWSEQAEGFLPEPHITVTFSQTGPDSRRITVEGDDRF